ncbi:MAG TPA: nitroreductase family protein [Oscillospiraceae bacterium]|nr:nitroreductase family protein [Oscillospiraceae bacterium]HPF56481.1 nitroreductase family protein [Clostridiales bacterium]HPK35108.1 nitroreductase family protein [Oscillospiraceae bacterium]HPR75259.1 nitroreductase family protein [Oscillospiraceae bacterium]
MNETLKVIAQRYSCRDFDGRMPERDKLEAIALAAVQSPSGMNRQPWRIVVVNNKAIVDELDDEGMRILKNGDDSDYYNLILKRGGKLFYNAPCMFLILKQSGREVDIGIVSENIALAATSLGLSSVIAASPAIPLKGQNGDMFRKKFNLPDGWEFGLSVLVGYAVAEGSPHQPDLSKIRFIE